MVPENMVICNKLKVLLKYYAELESLSKDLTYERYSKELLLKRAIERELQLIVECATDINSMILKKIGKGPAKDYFNSFIDLAENAVIDMDFALKISPSTGLRNILVHEYQEIDDEIVFKSITKALQNYRVYMKVISEYLGCV